MQCERTNKSVEADIDKDATIGEGSYKFVYGGVYCEGVRKGELCVAKELKAGPTELQDIFTEDLRIHQRAAHLIGKFNEQKVVDKAILLNQPEVWRFQESNALTLVEPYVEAFTKFNSNTGWVGDQSVWSDILQALSHFSYHASGGSLLLCDLQGAVSTDAAVLTDPVVMSRTGEYGATDMGRTGILNFFHKHTCNAFCAKHWAQPRGQEGFYDARSGTSAVRSDGSVIDPASLPKAPVGLPGGGAGAVKLAAISEDKAGVAGVVAPVGRPPRPKIPAWKLHQIRLRAAQRRTALGVSTGGVVKPPLSPSTTHSKITVKVEKESAGKGVSGGRLSGPGSHVTEATAKLRRSLQDGGKKTWKARKVA